MRKNIYPWLLELDVYGLVWTREITERPRKNIYNNNEGKEVVYLILILNGVQRGDERVVSPPGGEGGRNEFG